MFEFSGAVLLGGNVTQTIAGSIARTSTFQSFPAMFMYGEYYCTGHLDHACGAVQVALSGLQYAKLSRAVSALAGSATVLQEPLP